MINTNELRLGNLVYYVRGDLVNRIKVIDDITTLAVTYAEGKYYYALKQWGYE